ncbi:NUDIX hydrolase [Chloroflexi bacterium CFX2]|nr:NUDIX hydrolase [Chloroflexi bacterium CFX2]
MRVKHVVEHYPRQTHQSGLFKLCPFCGTPLLMMESDHTPRPACSSCGFVQHRNPAPTVSVLVVDGEQVLLGKRGGDPGKGTWSLPSGYIEYEEDFLTTAIREVKEETGLDVMVESVINVISSFVSPKFHFLGLYVAAQVVGGTLKAGDDLDAVEWFPLNGPLPAMGFEEDTSIIELYRNGFRGIPVINPPTRAKARSNSEREN